MAKPTIMMTKNALAAISVVLSGLIAKTTAQPPVPLPLAPVGLPTNIKKTIRATSADSRAAGIARRKTVHLNKLAEVMRKTLLAKLELAC